VNFAPLDYQTQGTDALLSNDRFGLFAEMGLGKSAMVLSALNQLAQDGDFKAALVVAPLRVANLTWPNEVKKWDQFKWMKVESLRKAPPSGSAQICTINYESLPKLKSLEPFSHVIFDELTRCKNPKSKRIRALTPLFRNHVRWGLTGTPRPNSLMELFAQIRILDSGKRLGTSFTQFRDRWFVKGDYMGYTWNPRPHAEAEIYHLISDMTLTLRSSDHLDIADTVVEDIDVPLPDTARDVYEELERELLVALDKGDLVALNAAALCGKLLQIAGGTVYDEARGVHAIHDAKVKALKALLKSLGKERALVFTNFIHERERVVAAIPGAVDASKFKGDIEDAWNSGSIPVLVADPRSLGHGLNLQQGGRTVVWFSPTWSREQYDQANARVARKGQTEVPQVFRILCPNTIDDAVVESLREKGDGQNEMMRVLANLRLTANEKRT
jgi:SNF2 family DNA or RNA helicase